MVLPICSLIALGFIVFGIVNREEYDAVGITVGGLMIVGLFGFLLIGCTVPVRWTSIPTTDFTITRGKNTTMIETSGLSATFTDAKTYNEAPNVKRVFVKRSFNSYNVELDSFISIDGK